MRTKPNIQTAKKLLAGIYGDTDFGRIHAYLAESDEKMKLTAPENFGMEFLAVRLAIATLSWQNLCAAAGFTDEAETKLFLKAVMEGFQSPKFKDLAVQYGEYLYGEYDGDGSSDLSPGSVPVVALSRRFFERLKLGLLSEKTGGPDVISESFRKMVDVLEGFRSEFETQLLEELGS